MQVFDVKIAKNNLEMTKHGESFFPVAVYNTLLSKNVLGYMPLHWHEEIQFLKVLDGEISVSVYKEKIDLKKGEGLFLNSEVPHSIRPKKENSRYLCIDINRKFLSNEDFIVFEKYIIEDLENLTFYVFNKEKDFESLDIIDKFYEIFRKKEYGYELDLQILGLVLFRNILKSNDKNIKSLKKSIYTEDERIKTLLNFIHENYNKEILLEDLGNVINLSRSECCRFFKEMTGSSPIDYLKNYRLNKGLELLRNEDKSITEISHLVGFNSVSYFISEFKKLTGVTPLQFQKSSFNENK